MVLVGLVLNSCIYNLIFNRDIAGSYYNNLLIHEHICDIFVICFLSKEDQRPQNASQEMTNEHVVETALPPLTT